MRLLEISAKNYRTLEDIVIPFRADYCSISGKNNAGKSNIIRLLLGLAQPDRRSWRESEFEYKENKTQWLKNQAPIIIVYKFRLNTTDDPALIDFIRKIASKDFKEEVMELQIETAITHSDDVQVTVKIGGEELQAQASKDILVKLRAANVLFHHNSTENEEPYYYSGGTSSFHEILLSTEEQAKLSEAAHRLECKIKSLAREHKQTLNDFLGRLTDKYDVEFSTQRYISRRHLFGITLHDKNVDVSLRDWGSGTQNRTRVLISILQAKRIKNKTTTTDKITPIVVIEEPESFLHPSAQSEFGKVLRDLASELGIQIIVTTHSPYILNRKEPEANILLCRLIRKGRSPATSIVDTTGAQWMAPFAEHLGIPAEELKDLKSLFPVSQKVLLVEGDIDKNYWAHLQSIPEAIKLQSSIEIVSYGGCSVLQNTALLKFALSNYNSFFITFDLDVSHDIAKSLKSIGLIHNRDFTSIGLNKPGRKDIEGLLPDRIISAVHARETDLVRQLTSTDTKERKEAKLKLKSKFLEEFMMRTDYTHQEMDEFNKLTTLVNKRFE